MAFDLLAKEMFESLPYEKQLEVVDFIMFLSSGITKKRAESDCGPFPFDVFAGGLNYIADDFDEIPEGFEEYV